MICSIVYSLRQLNICIMDLLIKWKVVLKEIRWTSWIKNIYIFVALVAFHGNFQSLAILGLAFVALSFTSSIVYILNDIKDRELDKKHPDKKERPIAAGKMSISEGYEVIVILAVLIGLALFFIAKWEFVAIVVAILVFNFLYTNYFKHIPYIEFIVLGILYVLRVVSGFLILGLSIPVFVPISVFFFTVITFAIQRYIEKTKYGHEARKVLAHYTEAWLRRLIVFSILLFVMSYFFATAFITGPIIYTNTLIIFLALYMNELVSQSNNIHKLSDSWSKILLSNRIIAVGFSLVLLALAIVAII